MISFPSAVRNIRQDSTTQTQKVSHDFTVCRSIKCIVPSCGEMERRGGTAFFFYFQNLSGRPRVQSPRQPIVSCLIVLHNCFEKKNAERRDRRKKKGTPACVCVILSLFLLLQLHCFVPIVSHLTLYQTPVVHLRI